MRLSYRLGAAIAVAATGIFAVAAPAVAGAGQRATAVPGGTQVWAQRFGGAHLSASATSVTASPDKAVVYVTGVTAKTQTGLRNEVTVAYSAATGKQLWLARYQGTGHHPRGGFSSWCCRGPGPQGPGAHGLSDRRIACRIIDGRMSADIS